MKPGEGGAGFVGLTRGAGRVAGARTVWVELVPGGGAEADTQAPRPDIRPIEMASLKALIIPRSQS